MEFKQDGEHREEKAMRTEIAKLRAQAVFDNSAISEHRREIQTLSGELYKVTSQLREALQRYDQAATVLAGLQALQLAKKTWWRRLFR